MRREKNMELMTFFLRVLGAEIGAVLINFFKSAGNIVHVVARTEEHALLEPNTLFSANEIAVWTICLVVVQPGGSSRQIGSEGFVPEHWLMMQRKAVAGRTWNSLGLKSLDYRGARRAKFRADEAQHKQMAAMPRAGAWTFLRVKARKSHEPGGKVFPVAVAGSRLRFQTVKLRVEDGALEFTEAVVARNDVMLVPNTIGNPPAILDRAASRRQPIIIRG